jgi:D-alanyl-D-alanine carboxypeptidase/D-alanyl-D-alanine-endopeptidase (penicillin-binding protein 4)
MAVRDRGPRRRWRGWLPEALVVLLLVAAGLGYQLDLGERWFGFRAADPVTEPAAVLPPEGLRLPAFGAAGSVAGTSAPRGVDPAKVAAAIQPFVRRGVLGRHVGLLVTDLRTGKVVLRQGAPTVTPASTAKLLTSTAALASLGPMARFRTTVRWVPASRRLVLVGGGDPFLASAPPRAGSTYPQRADLATLANAAAQRLGTLGVKRVRLAYDDSAFTGPTVNPTWSPGYVGEEVPPITALEVDEGRSPTGFGYLQDPTGRAVEVFRDALRRAGVKVGPQVARVPGSSAGTEVAGVSSAPLGEIVERTLAVSDNQAAEALARHVGRAERQEGSFAAGTAAVLDVVRRLGIEVSGDRLYDGSGLSRADLVRPETLAGVLRAAASDAHPELRQVVTGLPVAGFTGTMATRFDEGPDAARGRVRAKTGTLTGVHGLAGVADDLSGGRMVFVLVADRVRYVKNLEAQERIDRIAAALGACRCRVGSSS